MSIKQQLFLIFCINSFIYRKGCTENFGAIVLGKSLTDATSGNAAGPSQAIGRDIGIRIEIRRT